MAGVKYIFPFCFANTPTKAPKRLKKCNFKTHRRVNATWYCGSPWAVPISFIISGYKFLKRRNQFLEKKVRILSMENSELKKINRKLSSKKYTAKVATDILERSFTRPQARILVKGTKRAKQWSQDDIINGLLLRCFSMRAFRFLREKNLIPLPAPSTLRLWVKDFRCPPGKFKFTYINLSKSSVGASHTTF